MKGWLSGLNIKIETKKRGRSMFSGEKMMGARHTHHTKKINSGK